MLSQISLFFVFSAPCLAVRTVPVNEDDEGEDKKNIGDQNGEEDGGDSLVLVIIGEDDPGVHL